MLIKRRKQGGFWSFLISILLHVGLIVLLLGGVGVAYHQHQVKQEQTGDTTSKNPTVQAVAVDQNEVEKNIQAIKEQRAAKRQKKLAWEHHLQEQAQQAEQQRQQEQTKLQHLKQQQQAFQKKAQAEKSQAQKQLARLRKLKAKTQQKLQQLQAQKQKLTKQNQAVSQKLTQTQQALQQEQSQVMKQRLQDDLKKEQAEQKKLQHQQMVNQISRYKTLILNAIGQKWIIPQQAKHNLSAQLMITLAQDGSVLNVKVVKSSGSRALDRSAVTAVYQASPLPVPHDSQLLQQFKQLQLTVRPKGVLKVET